MLKVIIKRRVPFLIVGVMCVLLGVVMISASTVTCGEDTMQEGDVCLTTGEDDSPVRLTYEQQKRGSERGGRVLLGAGVLALLVAGVGFAVAAADQLRNGREERERRDEWARRYERGQP